MNDKIKSIPVAKFKSSSLVQEAIQGVIERARNNELESIAVVTVRKDGDILTDFVCDNNTIALERLRWALCSVHGRVYEVGTLSDENPIPTEQPKES